MAINLDFLRSQCPGVTRPKLLFSRFTIFWFKHSIFFHKCFTYDWIQHKITKIHVENDKKQENKKKLKW